MSQIAPMELLSKSTSYISKNILTTANHAITMIKTVRVSEKGQIAIPQSIREIMDIHQGDDLVIFHVNGKLLLEKAQKVEQNMANEFKDIVKFSEKSLKEVWDNKEDEIWSKYLP